MFRLGGRGTPVHMSTGWIVVLAFFGGFVLLVLVEVVRSGPGGGADREDGTGDGGGCGGADGCGCGEA
ncbi:hypothetical protein CP968_24685 [Streptomyces subrutilus]|uniref:Uncharacterized protein n=1 Tax=Streptomyces subrutilus TaxID=36818 RepID=A0A5P2UP62_9ACTN|nr:hypothetical protein CP968_24685 [Streptomyces subrutilus]